MIREVISKIFVNTPVEDLREMQLALHARIRRRKLSDTSFRIPSELDTRFQTLVDKNPQLVIDMMSQHLSYPYQTTLAIVPLSYIVLAMWTQKDGQTKVIGFKPQLLCSTLAMRDATGGDYFDKNYYVFHTNADYRRLKRKADREFRREQKQVKSFLREGKLGSYSSKRTFDYDRRSMSPINYLALAAREVISGEDTHSIPLPYIKH